MWGLGLRGVQPPPPPRCQLQPPEKVPTPPPPPRLRGCSHERDVLRESQSINSTDLIQQQKLGLRPKLIIKLLIRFIKYGSNY